MTYPSFIKSLVKSNKKGIPDESLKTIIGCSIIRIMHAHMWLDIIIYFNYNFVTKKDLHYHHIVP